MKTIHVGSRLNIDPARIKLLRAEINYTYIYFLDGTQVMVSTTIKKIESRLPENRFLRISRKEIINKGYVTGYRISKDKDYITLNGEIILIPSRRKKQMLREHFTSL